MTADKATQAGNEWACVSCDEPVAESHDDLPTVCPECGSTSFWRPRIERAENNQNRTEETNE